MILLFVFIKCTLLGSSCFRGSSVITLVAQSSNWLFFFVFLERSSLKGNDFAVDTLWFVIMQITFSTSCRPSEEFPQASQQMSSYLWTEWSAASLLLSHNLSCFILGYICQFSLSSPTAAVSMPFMSSKLLVAASSKLQAWKATWATSRCRSVRLHAVARSHSTTKSPHRPGKGEHSWTQEGGHQVR